VRVRALRPVAVTLVAFGAFIGVWAVVVADVVATLGVSPGGFGRILAVALACSAGVNVVAGSLAERWGTSVLLRRSLVAWIAATLATAAAGAAEGPALSVAVVAVLSVGGAVDVAANVAATAALAGDPGRLVRFHATFNLGAAAGAAVAGVLLRLDVPWPVVLCVPAVVAAVALFLAVGAELPAGAAGEDLGPLHALREIRRAGLVVLALVFAGGAMVEGGIDTWGVVVLREQLGVGVVVGAGAYVAGQLVAMASRASLGPIAGSLGAARGIAVGGSLAAVGLVMLALAPAAPAVAGLALAAAGIAVCWPLLLARAAEGLDRPGPVVGGVTAFGYLGLVLGPPIVGGLADAVGLRHALLALAAVAAAVAVVPSLSGRRATPSGGPGAPSPRGPGGRPSS
jgi:MFS family permease